MANENLKPTGKFVIEVIDKKTGKVIDKRVKKNLVLTQGKCFLASKLNSGGSMEGNYYIQIGTNGTAPTVGDTALGAYYRQCFATFSWDGVNNRLSGSVQFTEFTETKNICESGVVMNVLYNRVTFSSVEVNVNVNLRATVYLYP